MSSKVIDGVTHVWSIHDNAWVTLDYWNWVNGRVNVSDDEDRRLTADQHDQFDPKLDLGELADAVKDHQDINNMGDEPDAATIHERVEDS